MAEGKSLIELIQELVRSSILYAKQQALDAFEQAVARPLAAVKRRAAMMTAAICLMAVGVASLLTALLTWLSQELGVPAAFLIVGAAAFVAAAIILALSGRRSGSGRGGTGGTGNEGAPSGAGGSDQAAGDGGAVAGDEAP